MLVYQNPFLFRIQQEREERHRMKRVMRGLPPDEEASPYQDPGSPEMDMDGSGIHLKLISSICFNNQHR